jgi:hypothetical protein
VVSNHFIWWIVLKFNGRVRYIITWVSCFVRTLPLCDRSIHYILICLTYQRVVLYRRYRRRQTRNIAEHCELDCCYDANIVFVRYVVPGYTWVHYRLFSVEQLLLSNAYFCPIISSIRPCLIRNEVVHMLSIKIANAGTSAKSINSVHELINLVKVCT